MNKVYIVIDTDAQKYEDIVIGIYSHPDTAEETRSMYEGMTAIPDTSRFKTIEENVM